MAAVAAVAAVAAGAVDAYAVDNLLKKYYYSHKKTIS
jgi:hypothetical protein